MDNYLSVLEDSLKKKLQILDELTDYTMQQQELQYRQQQNLSTPMMQVRPMPF